MKLKILIFVAILFLLDYYIYAALGGFIKSLGNVAGLIFTLFYWSSFCIFLLVLADYMMGNFLPHTALIYLRAIAFIAYLSKLFMVLPFLIEDIYRGLRYIIHLCQGENGGYDMSRTRFVRNMALGLAALPTASLIYGLLRNQYRFTMRKEVIGVSDLPKELEGLKIIQISDIHAGTFVFKEPLKQVVTMINNAEPDIVVFTGDLVNDKAEEAERFIDIFKHIKAPHGVYSILGNHDYGDYVDWDSPQSKADNLSRLAEIQAQMGWDLLRNENRIIRINGEPLAIIGVENYSTIERFPREGDLKKAYLGAEHAAFKLLLSHDPTHWDYEVNKEYKDIALTLSGHTHGFQFGIEIPGVIRWSPSQYMYEEWAGLYQSGNQFIYVNRGLGCLGYPGRVGILPEITEITLNSA